MVPRLLGEFESKAILSGLMDSQISLEGQLDSFLGQKASLKGLRSNFGSSLQALGAKMGGSKRQSQGAES